MPARVGVGDQELPEELEEFDPDEFELQLEVVVTLERSKRELLGSFVGEEDLVGTPSEG